MKVLIIIVKEPTHDRGHVFLFFLIGIKLGMFYLVISLIWTLNVFDRRCDNHDQTP